MKRTFVYIFLVAVYCLNIAAGSTNGKKKPVSSFSNREVTLHPSWIKNREALNTTYLLKLVPFYQLTNASYGVYATIRNEY